MSIQCLSLQRERVLLALGSSLSDVDTGLVTLNAVCVSLLFSSER